LSISPRPESSWGSGGAPTFVATMALVARWFPSRLFPILVALTETSGMLGAALGQEILGFIVESAGWRAGMSLCGWLGALILVLTWLLVRDQPRSNVPEPARRRCPPPP